MQASSLLAPKSKGKKSILEQPLPKGKSEVSLSAFGYLFMEVLSRPPASFAYSLPAGCVTRA
jgi:hypothetical protein